MRDKVHSITFTRGEISLLNESAMSLHTYCASMSAIAKAAHDEKRAEDMRDKCIRINKLVEKLSHLSIE